LSTAAVRRYWQRLTDEVGCIITGAPAEIAHCHGASIVERMQEPKAKGKKLARYDWLVIPLSPWLHRLTQDSLDANPHAWEQRYGTQAEWIDFLAAHFKIDLWALAKQGAK
jgi:hypothetical protein